MEKEKQDIFNQFLAKAEKTSGREKDTEDLPCKSAKHRRSHPDPWPEEQRDRRSNRDGYLR